MWRLIHLSKSAFGHWRILLIGLVSRLRVALSSAAAILVASAMGQTTQLSYTVVPGIAHATLAGAPPPNQTVYFTIALKPRFPSELQAFVSAASDPRSPTFHQWLTPAQVGEQFGASASTVSTVVNYLRSKGIRINLQAPDDMAILAQGTVVQVQNAFGTVLKNYRGPDIKGNFISYRANSTPLKVPTAWASDVQAVTGIETWNHAFPKDTMTLTPPLTRGCYGLVTSYMAGSNGQGETVGISNWDGFRLSNVPLYISAFNLPVPSGGAGSNISVIPIQGGSGSGSPGGEGDLDIQMELGTAPLANITIYDGGGDQLSVITKEASDNEAEVISESYGWFYPDPSTPNALHAQHLAMSAQGMTYMEATGDSGTDVTGDYNGSDPEIFGVGGTIADVNSNTGARINEVGWDGSGGGWTTTNYSFNVRPPWQQGSPFPSQPNQRLLPDVGVQAGGPGAFTIYFDGSQTQFDGTSCASPTFAGGLTVVEELLGDSGANPRLGNIGPLVYAQAGRPDVWYDVTQGDSNGVLPNGQTSNPHVGWDFETGWGAPNFDALYNSFLQQVTLTPYSPTLLIDAPSSNPPLVGSWLLGDETSVSNSDGIYYQVASQAIPQFGEAAAFGAQFFIPANSALVKIDLEANSGGIVGGTNMVWLYNWNTTNYDLIGSAPLDADGSNDKVLTVRTSSLPNYIGPGGEVDAIVRGHFPIRPFVNQMPSPFTYRVDFLELLVR